MSIATGSIGHAADAGFSVQPPFDMYSCRAASRPEAVRQALSEFGDRLLRSGDPRFLNALRYFDSS